MPKYVEERVKRPKKEKPIHKLGKKVLKDKILSLERQRDQLISMINSKQDYDARFRLDGLLFVINQDIYTLRDVLEKKNGNN